MRKATAAIIIVGLIVAAGLYLLNQSDVLAPASNNGPTEPVPTLPPVKGKEKTVAEGRVVPVSVAVVSAPTAGIISEINAVEGGQVRAGDVIVRWDTAKQMAAIALAQAQVAATEAKVAEAKAGPRAQDIAIAEAALAAARAARQKLDEGANESQIVAARAELADAQAILAQAQAAYDQVKSAPDIGMRPESLRLQQATNAYNAAKARLDALLKPASAADIAAANAEISRAQAQLDLAKAGPRPETIAVAQSELDVARAQLEQAKAALVDLEVRAPISGTVIAVNFRPGEYTTPGAAIVQIADLSAWQIETEDLTETNVVGIREGQAVTIVFDAIPGLQLTGKVVRIKPVGESKRGDITFTVVIKPDRYDERLRWNMTATTTFNGP